MNNTHKHTWKFYALIWLMYMVGLYGMDWVAGHAKVGYKMWPIIWYPVEATFITAILWLIEEKPFRKKK